MVSLLAPGGFVQGTALTKRTRPVRSGVRGGLLVVLGAAELFVEA